MVDVGFYLTVSEAGRVRVTKGKPPLAFDEITIRLQLVVPKRFFERPLIQAKVVLDESLAAVQEITPEIVLNTAELIERQTGMKVELKVLPAGLPKPDAPVPASPCASCGVDDCDPAADPCDERKVWLGRLPKSVEIQTTEQPDGKEAVP